MHKIIPAFYFLIALLNLSGIFFEVLMLERITKYLLMPVLIVYVITKWSGEKYRTYYFALAALVLSWAGDVLLSLQTSQNSFFIYGLIFFLLAHLAYIFCYFHLVIDLKQPQNKTFLYTRVVALALTGAALMTVLRYKVGDLLIPVGVYTIVIILMAIFAVYRKDKTSTASFSLVYAGALMFILSDGMIAVNKFLNEFGNSGVYIMLTYIIAQFLIVKGILKHQQFIQELSEG